MYTIYAYIDTSYMYILILQNKGTENNIVLPNIFIFFFFYSKL